MHVIITRNGEADLEAIYQYHAEYTFEYADKFHDEIIAFMIEKLSHFPELGREVSTVPQIRKLVYDSSYNIYYLIKEDTAYILYILDGRRILNDQIQFLQDHEIDGLM
ncbi:type II toxin-antitoxin system RelE/ParE family toxin [Terasakiella sp. SH-1]|uniref:type II toxin-antitoxin system RelE/ParE family toxin n=1 Tax=Terasakiella sp. SH-1 TaxID=2560057 RepID=UPI0010739F1F|nr:type II toxin-antitoxin system RelE/ParE family toxin [Terasakiella sp. SH-1]